MLHGLWWTLHELKSVVSNFSVLMNNFTDSPPMVIDSPPMVIDALSKCLQLGYSMGGPSTKSNGHSARWLTLFCSYILKCKSYSLVFACV